MAAHSESGSYGDARVARARQASPLQSARPTLAFGEPLSEPAVRRVEVAAKTVVEARDLVPELKQTKLEPSLRIADVCLPFVGADRGAALVARHVVGVCEGA
jgi:hypothetical protein